MIVASGYQGTPGLGSSAQVEIRDPLTGTVLSPLSHIGVSEVRSGIYAWSNNLVEKAAYESIWYDGLTYSGDIIPGNESASAALIASIYHGTIGVSPVQVQVNELDGTVLYPLNGSAVRQDRPGVYCFCSTSVPVAPAYEFAWTEGDGVFYLDMFYRDETTVVISGGGGGGGGGPIFIGGTPIIPSSFYYLPPGMVVVE